MKSLALLCTITSIYAVPVGEDVNHIIQKVEGILYEKCKINPVTGSQLVNLFLDKFINVDADSAKPKLEEGVKNTMAAPVSSNNAPQSPATSVSAPIAFPVPALVASSSPPNPPSPPPTPPSPAPVPPSPAPNSPSSPPVTPSTAPAAPRPPTFTASSTPAGSVPNVPKSSGTTATLTRFTGSVGQCVTNLRDGMKGVAVNPLLLGFTPEQWNSQFSNAKPENIPWCNKKLRVTVKGRTETFDIIDTCDPTGKGAAKCDYNDVIDFYGSYGQQFLQSVVGGEFFQGPVEWQLL